MYIPPEQPEFITPEQPEYIPPEQPQDELISLALVDNSAEITELEEGMCFALNYLTSYYSHLIIHLASTSTLNI